MLPPGLDGPARLDAAREHVRLEDRKQLHPPGHVVLARIEDVQRRQGVVEVAAQPVAEEGVEEGRTQRERVRRERLRVRGGRATSPRGVEAGDVRGAKEEVGEEGAGEEVPLALVAARECLCFCSEG